MSDLVVINGVNIGLEVANDQVTTTSLDIAAVFEKRHDNIIAQIKALPQDEFTHLNFKVSNYKDSTGRTLPCYNLTRDAFSLLVMGFTGEKAYKWKIAFIKAFNEMEKRLKNLEQEQMQKLAFHQSLGYKSQLEQQKANYTNEIKALKYDLSRAIDELEVLKGKKNFDNEENLRLLQKELAKYGLVIFNELDFSLWSENLTKNIIGETKRRLDDLISYNYQLLKEKFDRRLENSKTY
ncbi:Rha family transcriptional regulator [Campylobacter sp. 2018MI35]|uniref:Rha family transcriptional regulator n=1 Tax=Campylobacter molothri TaxID=1032242 RepID=UPI0019066200|nr:Rha family transcriptional regulator [Campylobacter sp. 2018MI35]MBK1999965.1 Rha family transcriptional regulator [Campylobacter sp. 2018MI35]